MATTKTSDAPTNIYAKLGQVMNQVSAVKKGQRNEQQGFMFRGIDDMMNALHNEFASNGIIIVPQELEHLQDQYEYKDARGNSKVQFRSRVHMQYTFVSCDDGTSVAADGWGEAADNGDKGYNKCKSIALKYVLMQMFLVPTQDIADPDKTTPDELTSAGHTDQFLDMLLADIRTAANMTALTAIYNENQPYHTNSAFMNALSSRKRELQ